MNKLTIDFVKSEFEKKGWTCVSDEYIDAHSKLEYICPEGHHGSIRWGNWQQGQGCSVCAGNAKLTLEFIQKNFEGVGYKLTSTKYINSLSKLGYICPNGHKHSITWAHWQQGQRCPTCAGITKLTLGFIQRDFEKDDYKLTSTKYINSLSKLGYICPNGHKHSITWGNWQQGYRCPTCYFVSMTGSNHPNWKGGVSCEPYCDIWKDKEYAEAIKQRDGHKCMNPCCNSRDPEDLTRHHIEYNRKLCRPKDLITVCRSCNFAANYDREWHEAWYKAIMYRRYGYIY
ncbi:hypothetical protein KAW18_11105 [candidate division WOR-3 bacterium]|jgi:hypothetical protein|nr:hypothetical protein [candidate division WOR-3 bacterium]